MHSKRREFLKLCGAAIVVPQWAQAAADSGAAQRAADYTLHVRQSRIEVAPGRVVSTTTYNGQFPGPLLRLTAGRPGVIEVRNETSAAQSLNWHGLGPAAPQSLAAGGACRACIVPSQPGLHFYHSAALAGTNLEAGLYSGQVGPLFVEPSSHPGRFEREFVLVLKEFEPALRRGRQGYELDYAVHTINGRTLGHGEPLRVRARERVLFHFLNASATEPRRIALPGHQFVVVALDGSPVSPRALSTLRLAPAERITAWVPMHQPGVWVLGELDCTSRRRGMGVVVEYQGCRREAQWVDPPDVDWQYGGFRAPPGLVSSFAPDAELDVLLTRRDAPRCGFSRWEVNGGSFSVQPGRPALNLRRGARYRLNLRNATADALALHLQGHRFELVRVAGQPLRGVMKDVASVGPHERVDLHFVANWPGEGLLYSCDQWRRDFGLMARLNCA